MYLRTIVGGGFCRLDDVAAAGCFEDLFCSLRPLRVVAMHRNEIAALSNPSRIPLRFHFRDSGADQPSDEAAGRARRPGTGEGGDYRTSSDERSNAGYGEGPNPDEPSQNSTDRGARARAGGDAFWCLRVDLMRKILRGAISLRENRSEERRVGKGCRCWGSRSR